MTESGHSEASTGWFGSLLRTPLFAVLRKIQRQRLGGTLTVSREDQSRRFYFQDGELRTAHSSREDHRIGANLIQWGYISEKQLEEALASQREGQARIDQILVEKGLITRTVLDAEARRLMEQIVFSTLSWRDGDFYFLNATGVVDPDISFSLSATEMIVEGIRRIPESDQFLALLGDLSAIPIRIEDRSSSPSPHLPPEVSGFLSRIDGKSNARTLLPSAPGSQIGGAKILFALLYCGFIDMREPEISAAVTAAETRKATPQAPAPAEPSPADQFLEDAHRDLVRNTYRRIDWLSYYDLLAIPTQSSPPEILKAYRERARLFDPALQLRPYLADCGRELNVLSERLRAARDTLASPAARQAYDQKIEEAQVFAIDSGRGTTGAPPARSSKVREWTVAQNYKKAKELIGAHATSPRSRCFPRRFTSRRRTRNTDTCSVWRC